MDLAGHDKRKKYVTVCAKLPTGKDGDDKTARQRLFSKWDTNANGLLAITEVRKGMQAVLGDKAFEAYESEIEAAFDKARVAKVSRSADGAKFVEKGEFRLFFLFFKRTLLEYYLGSIVAPKPLVGAWPSREAGMLSLKEFTTLMGPLTEGWNIEADLTEAFRALDADDRRAVGVGAAEAWARNMGLQADDVTEDDSPPPSELEQKMMAAIQSGRLAETDLDLTANLDLPAMIAKLPISVERKEYRTREKLFASFDPNHNGQLSLAEVDLGLRILLATAVSDASKAIDALAPAVARAFHAAKDVRKAKGKSKGGDHPDSIDRDEFRLLLVYLRRYWELLGMFDAVDTSDDRRVDEREFNLAIPLLAAWGAPVADAHAEFLNIDINKGGYLLFDEFCSWALKRGLDKEPGDEDAADATLKAQHKMSEQIALQGAKETRARLNAMAARDANAGYTNSRDVTAHLDLGRLAAKLPTGKSHEAALRREQLFKALDGNANRALSMAEVETGIKRTLGLAPNDTSLSPAIARAFHAAKASQESGDPNSVSLGEMRTLLVYVKRYFELLQIFDAVDSSDDRRVDYKEFQSALPLFAQWGVPVADAAYEFRSIDGNRGGLVLFDEFAGWAIKRGLDKDARDNLDGEEDLKHHHQNIGDAGLFGVSPRSSPRGAAVPNRKWMMPNLDLLSVVRLLPCGKSDSDKLGRQELFTLLDPDGYGALTAAEVDDAMHDLLQQKLHDRFPPLGHGTVSDFLSPAIARAFRAVTEVKDLEHVSRREFRQLLTYIKWYFSKMVGEPDSPRKSPRRQRSPIQGELVLPPIFTPR